MKKLILPSVLFLCMLSLFKTTLSQSAYLDINNIRANIDPNTLFNHIPSYTHSFEAPVGSGAHSIYTSSLWLAGKNGGTVKTNVNTFYDTNQKIAGPIMNSSLYAIEGTLWDKVWEIQCQEVQEFVAWYECSINNLCDINTNFPGYQIPAAILTWPAHGDASKGQTQNLAPFFDRDGDNFYDPNSGDYPLIKGDEAIYFIYNDERSFYTGTDTHSPMKTEVHGMAYAFSTNDAHLNNTIFLNYKIYNRSNTTYNDCYLGFWTDFDLGNYADDFLGSDVSRSSYYAYNGDSFDENNGVVGYGANLPAQGVTILKGPKQDDNGQDDAFGIGINESINGFGFGDGITDNEHWGLESFVGYNIGSGNLGTPSSEANYYNYLSGKMLNATPLSYGSTGTNCNYMYPGNSDPYNYGTGGIPQSDWSEDNSGNAPGDRRGVGSSGPFTLPIGGFVEIDLALVFGRDMTGSGPQAGIAAMTESIDSIRSQYLAGLTTSYCSPGITTNINSNIQNESNLVIHPNPFNNQFKIDYKLENSTALLEVYNVIGEKIKAKTITQNSTLVDLSDQTKGFYFVTITDGANKISRKIVKQ